MLTKEQENKLRELIFKASRQRETYATALGVYQSNIAYRQLHDDEAELDRFIAAIADRAR